MGMIIGRACLSAQRAWSASWGLFAILANIANCQALTFARVAMASWTSPSLHERCCRRTDGAAMPGVAELDGHTAAVTCLAFSTDGTRLVSGGHACAPYALCRLLWSSSW